MIRSLLVVAFALVLGAIRLLGHKSQLYQATAHLFVGALFGVFIATWRAGRPDYGALWVALGLSVLELFAFLAGRLL